jgi:3-phenylpropionate/trans-cinnamate dioxygenase ferredoxin reductase component
MATFKYLIIGSGMTAQAAALGIREIDKEGSIGMVGIEQAMPYKRPPLTKQLWKGKPLDSIWLKLDGAQVTLHTGRKIVNLLTADHQVVDDQGVKHSYEKLLLATGGKPRRLPFGEDSILYYRTLDDYQRLRDYTQHSSNFAVIGGGFIGSEIAAALAMNGKKVSMIFPEDSIGARVYPHDLAQYLNEYFRQKSVEVFPEETLVNVASRGDKQVLILKSGREIVADHLVGGIGIQPRIELAQAAGLAINNGIVVDELLHAGQPDIFAAGDVAEFYNPALDRRMRVEHEDNALSMGRQAGRNMAGANEPYHHLPYFYSDLFELGYEAVGVLDSHLAQVADWLEPFQKGVIYYLDQDRVRGVLLWNVWGAVPAARKLIAEPGPFQPADLKGRIHEGNS